MEESGEGSRKSTESWNEGALHGSDASVGRLPAVLPPALTLCIELWMPMADRGGLLFVCLERRFVTEGDSCQVRTVTGEHELTRLLTGDRLYKSFVGRFDCDTG
jgi:hypothetical protein